ncbi:cob(I)yrinic acid a,c-diamide adenosyltransferase [Spongiibacter nanhainus]|uniref:Corrinoid adenosyltransferase n=1 Tax=Spongiibacter nanhainus TaxID=2794344 RepID=A0A7T4UQW2_9GAMM|nr:cob(I)yrinic acid a,c-diamide adenosyltransferase [Spongiibacter nanhainus]QQD19101.1 cob(I)yrinic acid a,c-diamide adenosyltransferase [Spongiibacter nanhainus]
MGHRLSKIYTRTGDDGTTGLGDGSRINKDHQRMESIGTVDELNSHIGLLITELSAEDPYTAILSRIQHDLFDLGGELAVPGYTLVSADRIGELESTLDELNEDLPPLKNFILPGGSKPASLCHLARAVCRRAERCVVALSRSDEINDTTRQYLNRLSDLLFVMARLLARRDGGDEVLWVPADKR